MRTTRRRGKFGDAGGGAESSRRKCVRLSQSSIVEDVLTYSNRRLRAFLREKGVSDVEMDEYTGMTASHDDDIIGSAITTTAASTTDTSRSGLRRPSGPIQDLTTMLTTRKPCCSTRPGSQTPTSLPAGDSADASQDEDSTPPERSSDTNNNTARGVTRADTSMLLLQPVHSHVQRNSLSPNTAQTPDALLNPRGFGIDTAGNTSQLQWQNFQQQLQTQQYNIQHQAPSTLTQVMSRHRHTPSYTSDTATSYPLASSSYPIYSPTFLSPMTDPTVDMSNLLPHDIQSQFLRGLDTSHAHYGHTAMLQTRGQQQAHQASQPMLNYSGMDNRSQAFKLEEDNITGLSNEWTDFQGHSGWSNPPQSGSAQPDSAKEWDHGMR
jgi:hypothetical protein